MNLSTVYANALHEQLHELFTLEDIVSLIERPKNKQHGDLAFPCFQLAKQYRQSPSDIAKQLSGAVKGTLIDQTEAIGPYVNVFFRKKEVSKKVLTKVMIEGNDYGSVKNDKGVVSIDFSSPNIAKPFSMGHLRSTVIGQSLALLAQKNGYQPVKINHLGDWGTQFGKLMCAYTKWGSKEEVKSNPIPALMKLYVMFHEKAAQDSSLNDEGRAWFKRLEDGEPEAVQLWKWFKGESLKEFQKVYDLLGVQFDRVQGESFYNDQMNEVVKKLEKCGLLTESDGAEVVEVGEDMPPCLIKKKDGTTLYATRDLAAAIYRKNTDQFHHALYIVGGEQELHFKQLFHVLKKMGYDWSRYLFHVPFGLILKDGKKMSTRKGQIILLEEVLQEAVQKVKSNMEVKNPHLNDIDHVAKQVGTGAVIFHDLKNERLNSVEFNLDQMLTFEGETGPYVQYTHARAQTILERSAVEVVYTFDGLTDEHSWEVIKLLSEFPKEVQRAYATFEPSVIAKYTIRLAQSFNSYYGKVKILDHDDQLMNRLALTKSVTIVLKEGLRVLGVQAPPNM